MHSTHTFVPKFHNLEGNTVGERKKAFSKLLKTENFFSNEQELNDAIDNLQPKTFLEDLFYIDTLIHFKRTTKLLEIFKQGNELHITKIIKQHWFLKEITAKSSVQDVVNEILPCTSFSIRMKVLKKLSQILSEDQMDELFDCIQERYGIHIAIKFVHTCSLDKISKVLLDNDVTLRSNQVKCLLDRDLSTFRSYLEHHIKLKGTVYSDSSVVKDLAKKYPEEMLELKKENKIHVNSVGRRVSKKIMNIIKDNVTNDIGYYSEFLNNPVIVRKLGSDFKKVYLNTFPVNVDSINSYFIGRSLAKFYPKNRQWDLFVETFSQVFNQRVHDNLGVLDTSNITQLHPERKVIQSWAEIKYAETNDNSFLEYIEPSKAIPLIKEKINVTSSILDRRYLLEQMVTVCVRNDDMVSLEKVLKYVCFRHRNEDTTSRISLLNYIKYKCNLNRFSEKHWDCINEQIEILRVKDEYSFSCCSDFLKRYLEYLFINGKSFQNELATFLSDAYKCPSSGLQLNLSNPPVERALIIQMVNHILNTEVAEEMSKIQDCNASKYIPLLVLYVIEFSMKNKNYFINLLDFPILFDYVKSLFDQDELPGHTEYDIVVKFINYNLIFLEKLLIEKSKILNIVYHTPGTNYHHFKSLIKVMVTKPTRSEFENDLMHMYFSYMINYLTIHEVHNWFVKNEPQSILPYIDNIIRNSLYLDFSLTSHIYYLKQVKLLSYFNYDAQYISFYKSQLCSPQTTTTINSIKIFSILNSTDDFIIFVKQKFLPKKDKLDLLDEEMRNIYKSQCQVAKLLKNVSEPSKMMPVAIQFCVGDYLQSSLPSIYSLFYRSPENQLPLYIDILVKGAVSVRKHAIFLSCELLDSNFVKQLFESVDEKNVSAQKHLFLAIIKYFVKTPTPEMFNGLVSKLYTIDKNDKETLETLNNKLPEIPRKFKVPYTEKCWNFYEHLASQVLVDQYLDTILQNILHSSTEQYVSMLSHKFCVHIINSYFRDQKIILTYIIDFVCYTLKYREAEQEENFNIVFDIISTFKTNQKLQQVSRFFDKAFAIACEDEKLLFAHLLFEHWAKIFSPQESFEELISLQLVIKCKSRPSSSDNYANIVVSFYEEVMKDYGPYVHNKFVYSLNKVLKGMNIDKNEFLYKILHVSTTRPICVLVFDLLPKSIANNSKVLIGKILGILRELEDPVVKIHYNSYVRSTRM